MTHADLLSDLASSFDPAEHFCFIQPPLGSRLLQGGVPVPDLLVLSPHYRNPNIRIYEIKSNQADFDGELANQKWEKYLPFCDRFLFALGPGVKWEGKFIPPLAGLVVRGDKKWMKKKPAPINPHRLPLDERVLFALVFTRMKPSSAALEIQTLEEERKKLLSSEIEKLIYLSDEKLAGRARELVQRERDLSYRENHLQEIMLSKLQKALGTYSHVWGKDLEAVATELAREMVVQPMLSCLNGIRDNMQKILDGKFSIQREFSHEDLP